MEFISTEANINTEAIRGVVFDKDGTLFDFNAVWSVWCDRVVNELADGDSVIAHSLSETIGYDLQNRSFSSGSLIVSGAAYDTAKAMASVLSEKDASRVNSVCIKHTVGLPLAPVENLTAVLGKLKSSGLTLGVATNDSEASAHAQLADGKIAGYFEFVCGFDSGFGSKPNAGMLQAFCRATGIAASEVAMVGDSLHDIHSGIAAGAGLTVGVLTGPAKEPELASHADVVMADINGLLPLLVN